MTVEKINGGHLFGKTSDDVKAIYITNVVCHFMPKGFEKFFKNIEAIQISDSGLREINQDDLRPFPKLKEIYLQKNRLTTINSNLFDLNPKMTVIHLGNNRIRNISVNVFDPITDLQRLYLGSNVCVSKDGTSRNEINAIEFEIIEKCQFNNRDEIKEFEDLKREVLKLKKDFEDEKSRNDQKLRKLCQIYNQE